MGMIFQEYNLVDRLTVMENLLSGRLGYVSFWRAWRRKFPPEDVKAAFKLLERVGLEGYQDTRADALSGGQRQRVGIGRALMQAPDLLLVDEPTASLDPKTSRQIMRLLVELVQERGTPALVNIHDVALAQSFSDRIIGLRGGEIVFDGQSSGVTEDVLTAIYGEEDWSLTVRKGDDDSPAEKKADKKNGLIREAGELAAIDSTGMETRHVSAYYTRRWGRHAPGIISVFPSTQRGWPRPDGKSRTVTGRYRREMLNHFPRQTYGPRWQMETTFSMLKRLLGSSLHGRKRYAIDREIVLRVLTINLMIVLHPLSCFQQSMTVPYFRCRFL